MRFDPSAVSAAHWLLAILIVIFPTVVAYFLNYWALARVESSQVALLIFLQPIVASVLSIVLLDEVVTLRLVISSALVFLGVILATQSMGRSAASVPSTSRTFR